MKPYYAENMTYEEFLAVPEGMTIRTRNKEEIKLLQEYTERKRQEDIRHSGKVLAERLDAVEELLEAMKKRISDLEFRGDEQKKGSSYLRR